MNRYFNINRNRIFYLDNKIKYTYFNGRVFRHKSDDNTSQKMFKLPIHSKLDYIAYSNNLMSRLLRKGLHHLVPFGDKTYAFMYNKRVGLVNENKVLLDVPTVGSRPLSFGKIGGGILFGEYRSNPERSDISVFALDERDKFAVEKLYVFKGIRHIHGIYQDPFSGDIYITTGDEDDEAAIYKTVDYFKSVEKVLSGSQQTRVIKLLFDENFIYFGSDAPHEQNYLYKLNKKNKGLIRLQRVGSSVFHGCKINNWFFFSTAIEPSAVNKTKYTEVWASPDGDNWKCIIRLKKDIFPIRYFQYGQIFFPNGPGDGQNLWLMPFGTKYSSKSISIGLDEVSKLFYELS